MAPRNWARLLQRSRLPRPRVLTRQRGRDRPRCSYPPPAIDRAVAIGQYVDGERWRRSNAKMVCQIDIFEGFKGVSKRSAFVISKDGEILFAWSSDDPKQLPDFQAIKAVL